MATMSDHRQTLYELPTTRGRLTVADAIVLHRHQGLTKACCYVSAVDPWRFPADVDGHEVQSYLNVKRYVQQTVDQFTHTARKLSIYSDASVSAFLLSPLLVRKDQRPPLVRKSAAEKSAPLCTTFPTATAALGGAKDAAHLTSLSPPVVRPALGTASLLRYFIIGLAHISTWRVFAKDPPPSHTHTHTPPPPMLISHSDFTSVLRFRRATPR